MSARTEAVVAWLRDTLARSGARGLVFGLSGGIDSALVARLCQMAAPGRIVGVLMPCHSDPRDEEDALLVARHFDIPTVRVDLAPSYDLLTGALQQALTQLQKAVHAVARPEADDIKARVPMANVKPRIRMATLYFVGNSLNYVVAGTGNRSELSIGYFTKYGDGGVDLLPIGEMLKSEVREAARELGIPQPVIDKAPSAGLWLGQTDEDEMGFSYADLERYLTEGPGSVAADVATRIDHLIQASEHKRALAPTPGLK